MKKYKPIATYHDIEDIMGLFPSSTLKGDEADIVVKHLLSGEGNPYTIVEAPEGSIWTEEEVREDMEHGNFTLTLDGKYGVRFTRGDSYLLKIGSDGHGFYIDIYEAFDDNHPASTPQVPDKSLAIRILNFVLPYIPDHIRDEALEIIYKA